MTRLVSPIYFQGEPTHRSPSEVERDQRQIRGAAWHKLGLVIIDPEDVMDEWLRQALINEADRAYGRRRARA